MRPAEEIKKLVKNAKVQTSPPASEKIFNTLADELKATKTNSPAENTPDLWRIIMKSKITKLTAAAAIITIAAVIVSHFGGGLDVATRAYGMTDVPELFVSASNIHIKGKMYFPDLPEGDRNRVVDIEHWIDAQNGRWRSVKPGYQYFGPDKCEVHVSETICDGRGLELTLDRENGQASYSWLSDLQMALRIEGSVRTVMDYLCSDPELLNLYEIVGQEEIDGQIYDIWQRDDVGGKGTPHVKMQCWLSPLTGDFAKASVWMRSGEEDWVKRCDITTLKLNARIPDAVFTMDVPDGFQLTNTPETAPKQPLSRTIGSDGRYELVLRVVFVLNDGTAIACWGSKDKDSQQSQKELFANLQMGGDLPRLPYELYALKSRNKGNEETYHGRHLCHTELEGQFYEWALYVSPQVSDYLQNISKVGYTLLYRTNGDAREGAFTLSCSPDAYIRTDRQFQSLVLAAMKELGAPAEIENQVTDEGVLALAQQIRNELQ